MNFSGVLPGFSSTEIVWSPVFCGGVTRLVGWDSTTLFWLVNYSNGQCGRNIPVSNENHQKKIRKHHSLWWQTTATLLFALVQLIDGIELRSPIVWYFQLHVSMHVLHTAVRYYGNRSMIRLSVSYKLQGWYGVTFSVRSLSAVSTTGRRDSRVHCDH